jgi:hypothetical protein
MRRALLVAALVGACQNEPSKLELCQRAAEPVCDLLARDRGYDRWRTLLTAPTYVEVHPRPAEWN